MITGATRVKRCNFSRAVFEQSGISPGCGISNQPPVILGVTVEPRGATPLGLRRAAYPGEPSRGQTT